MEDLTSTWPKHEDGTNKTVGEMTEEEREAVMSAARARYWQTRNAIAASIAKRTKG